MSRPAEMFVRQFAVRFSKKGQLSDKYDVIIAKEDISQEQRTAR